MFIGVSKLSALVNVVDHDLAYKNNLSRTCRRYSGSRTGTDGDLSPYQCTTVPTFRLVFFSHLNPNTGKRVVLILFTRKSISQLICSIIIDHNNIKCRLNSKYFHYLMYLKFVQIHNLFKCGPNTLLLSLATISSSFC